MCDKCSRGFFVHQHVWECARVNMKIEQENRQGKDRRKTNIIPFTYLLLADKK